MCRSLILDSKSKQKLIFITKYISLSFLCFCHVDKVHKNEIMVDTEAVLVEIWDTCMVKYENISNLINLILVSWHFV